MAHNMTKQEQFFYDQAGYGYDPKTETREQGHERSAKALARAESWASAEGFRCEWSEDEDGCIGGNCEPCKSNPHHPDCMVCILHDQDGNPIQSLGSICLPTREYRRVIEAELALEAMPSKVSA